jgi:plasmid stabilization system protein ParE
MRKYRLAKRAEDDLIVIAQYGDEHFGVAQSNRYRQAQTTIFSIGKTAAAISRR